MGNTIQLVHSPTGEDAIYYNGQFQYIDYGTTKADVEYDIDAKIVFVIYDFIPLLYPQFCEHAHTKQFELFFQKSLNIADQYIGISKTVMDDIIVLANKFLPERANKIQYDYFYLGANFLKKNDKYAKVTTL